MNLTTYTFDNNGNQRTIETVSGVTTYTWSYENQMTGVELPDNSVITYTYAPVNRNSVELRVQSETETEIIHSIWDDQNLILEVDESSTVEAAYTLAPKPFGNLVSQHRDAESSFYHFDALGSTRTLTDATGTVSDSYFYQAFGKAHSSTGTTKNPYQWIGQQGYYYNEESNLYTLRQRQYQPRQGQFLSEDPIGFAAGDVNLYRYVGNASQNILDPSGLAGGIGISMDWRGCKEGRRQHRPIAGSTKPQRKKTPCPSSNPRHDPHDIWCDGLYYDPDQYCCVNNTIVEYDCDKQCCENNLIVDKISVYVVNRSRDVANSDYFDSHTDLIIPGYALFGFFGINTENPGDLQVGIHGKGFVNDCYDDWNAGPARRRAYVWPVKRGAHLSTLCELRLCPSQAAKMKAQAKSLDAAPGEFQISGNNCTTQACAILRAGGVALGEVDAFPGLSENIPGAESPRALVEDLQSRGAKCFTGYTVYGYDHATKKTYVYVLRPTDGSNPTVHDKVEVEQ